MTRAPVQTRSQRDLAFALAKVQQVANERDEQVKKIYGGLCHQFPVMVRTVGLAQTLAFHASKAGAEGDAGARKKAHRLLLKHVGELLGNGTNGAVERVQTLDTWAYLHDTRRVLAVWIYFKRFAVSVLKVESSQAAQDEDKGAGGQS